MVMDSLAQASQDTKVPGGGAALAGVGVDCGYGGGRGRNLGSGMTSQDRQGWSGPRPHEVNDLLSLPEPVDKRARLTGPGWSSESCPAPLGIPKTG